MVGAVVMTHGDDQGLILPPRLAPLQVVIVPIWRKDKDRATVLQAAHNIESQLQNDVRVKLDDREGVSPGWKFNDWEMRGVPLRIEIGPRDIANAQVMLARRDQPGRDGKTLAPISELSTTVKTKLNDIQSAIYQKAINFRDSHTWDVSTYDELHDVVQSGFARAWWAGDADDEMKIKEETKATVRCIPNDQPGGSGRCVYTGKPTTEVAIFGRAY
jgi:prolyl-tRNA synthetase